MTLKFILKTHISYVHKLKLNNCVIFHFVTQLRYQLFHYNKNSSGDEIANMNFYAVHPEATRIH